MLLNSVSFVCHLNKNWPSKYAVNLIFFQLEGKHFRTWRNIFWQVSIEQMSQETTKKKNKKKQKKNFKMTCAPRETGCSDVGGCRISEVNKGDMESRGLYLSIFISVTSATRDRKPKSSLYWTIWIWNALMYFELCPKDAKPLLKGEVHYFQRRSRFHLFIFDFVFVHCLKCRYCCNWAPFCLVLVTVTSLRH